MIHLRPYQLHAIDQMRDLMRKGCRSILYQGATGSGKTALTAHMLHTAAGKGMRSLFLVHRRELIKQSVEAFNKQELKHGIISAGFIESPTMRVQIASVQTLARRLNRTVEPRLIVWDECHHLAAASWQGIFRRFPHSYHIGLTATPERLDGQGLGTYFKEIVCGPSVSTLIEQGYLSPYKLYAPMHVSVEGVHIRMGDYVQSELSKVVDRPSITGDAVAHYRKYCYGKRAIVFAVSIQHSKHIVEQFQKEGFHAAHVDGETPDHERDMVLRSFADGNTQILSNVELFGEGYDCPAMEAAILLRPTQSLGLYLQQIGRALRPNPGKSHAVILDHVGNCERFGLPDDERSWTLDGHDRSKRGNKAEAISVKVCPRCFGAQRAGAPSCRFCGFVFEITPRKVQEKEGELSEVDLEMRRKQARQAQGLAENLEDLYRIGVARKYRYPRRWAHYVFQARQAKKLGKVT